ncbi:uncharacterized protein LOC117330114 [Pecten maximus]|uniref:uncharacterized protein LOC117330114 n=1 Tax=Pecten maximus TaxID=6579 RepID=UPI0014588671|nr:uncharacterized protein LOC117330114 [Pecten maximus]
MMGDYFSDHGDDDTENDETSDIWNISEISIPDSPGERTFNIVPKTRSNFAGRSCAGEELQKVSGNDNLITNSSPSVQDICESTKPRHPRLPIAPILKYYEILGPPRISAGQRSFDNQNIEDESESDNVHVSPTADAVSVRRNETLTQTSRKASQTSEKLQHSRRILTPDILPGLDKIPEEELYESHEIVSMVPVTSSPTKDNSETLTSFMGIKLLGMSME